MPLVSAPINTEMRITKVFAQGEVKRRLENLGILSGERISVLRSVGGNLIVRVKDGRIALDGDLARKIFVA